VSFDLVTLLPGSTALLPLHRACSVGGRLIGYRELPLFPVLFCGAGARSSLGGLDQRGLWDPEDKDPGIEKGPTVADQSAPHRLGGGVVRLHRALRASTIIEGLVIRIIEGVGRRVVRRASTGGLFSVPSLMA
jgi:hypothetical protein